MTRDQVISEARSWIGTPWRHQGRSRKRGVDCIGLLVVVARSFGLNVEDRTDYARDPTALHLLEHLRKQLVFVPPGANRLGTVGVFRQSVLPCHVGILAQKYGQPSVIHARHGSGRVDEELLSDALGHLVETGAFPGLVP
jgi:cell wall-associated NlpC family hydrolase